jgi:IclR family acetate operon transcriptional repressor
VFEYFDRIRRAASVTEVARALGYPQSSASVLLRSLVDLGYLEQDASRRTFLPTPRVTLLGSWIEPLLSPGGAIMRLMDELGEQTGETIILGVPSGEVVRYIHVVQATSAMRLHVGNGTIRPMAISGMGRLFMSAMDEARVRQIVQRYNVEIGTEENRLNLAAVRRDLTSIRADGYVPSFDRVTPGAGGISVLLPVAPHGVPMAVAIGGLSKTINNNRESFLQLIRKSIRRHLQAGSAELKAA